MKRSIDVLAARQRYGSTDPLKMPHDCGCVDEQYVCASHRARSSNSVATQAREIVERLTPAERVNFRLMMEGAEGGRYPLLCSTANLPFFDPFTWQPTDLGRAIHARLIEIDVERTDDEVEIREGDRVLGTLKKLDDTHYQCHVRRTRGFAGSFADALKLLRKLAAVLDKRCNAA